MKHPIPNDWDVPALFRQRLGSAGGRQRAMVADGHVLLILHDVPDPASPDKRFARFFWRKPDRTFRTSSVPVSTGIKPLRDHVETYAAAVDRLEDEVEGARRAHEWFAALREASPLLRSARNMHRALQEAREATGDDRELIALRDRAGDVERAAELVHQHARDGLDFTIAESNEEQAKASASISAAGHRLNLLAALFFPITALGALLGMNLESGLERFHAPYTFWIVSVVAFVLGFAVRATLPRAPT